MQHAAMMASITSANVNATTISFPLRRLSARPFDSTAIAPYPDIKLSTRVVWLSIVNNQPARFALVFPHVQTQFLPWGGWQGGMPEGIKHRGTQDFSKGSLVGCETGMG